jgi:hypothetical protein
MTKRNARIFAKLKSAIHEATEKAIPEYKLYLNSVLDKQIIAEDCQTQICDCNKCPTQLDQIANVTISSAMTASISSVLTEAWLKKAGITLSESEMRNNG